MVGNNILPGETTNQITLSPLQPNHNGTQYTCNYVATSEYVISNITESSNPHVVIITGK